MGIPTALMRSIVIQTSIHNAMRALTSQKQTTEDTMYTHQSLTMNLVMAKYIRVYSAAV